MEDEAARRRREYLKCSADAAYFIDSYGVIDDAQGHGGGGGTMPFRLWPAQVRLVWTLMTARLVAILKARQLGITWAVCGWALWMSVFFDGQVGFFCSKGQLEANEMLRRVKVLYERLPDWLRAILPALAKPPTASHIEWKNGSRITSLAATETAGSSFTASYVVMDEAAKMLFADGAYGSVKPTIDAGGRLVMLSSAFGVGNLFHRIWSKAASGVNGFVTVFLAWWERPGRDTAWYAKVTAESDDPAIVKQEYPSSATEAFLVSGRIRFPTEWVDRQIANIEAGLPRDAWPETVRGIARGLVVYRLPRAGRKYAIGADVAEGLEHGDYSTCPVVDLATGEEMACLCGKWEPDEFADLIGLLSDVYDAAEVIERNNHGHAVIAARKRAKVNRVVLGPDGRPGWVSDVKHKPLSIDRTAEALRDGKMIVHSQATVDEMRFYRVLDNGKTGAPPGMHDDRVMSWAVLRGWMSLHPASGPDVVGGPPLVARGTLADPLRVPTAPIRSY